MKRNINAILLLLFLSNSAFAQISIENSIYVSGVVTDSLNKPLKGANVVIKNTRTGVVVDENGKYKIDLSDFYSKREKIIVTFSCLGLKPIEKEIDFSESQKNQNLTIDITLKERAKPIICDG